MCLCGDSCRQAEISALEMQAELEALQKQRIHQEVQMVSLALRCPVVTPSMPAVCP